MHEHDGDGPNTILERRLHGFARGCRGERHQHFPFRRHSLLSLNHALIKQFRLDEVAVE